MPKGGGPILAILAVCSGMGFTVFTVCTLNLRWFGVVLEISQGLMPLMLLTMRKGPGCAGDCPLLLGAVCHTAPSRTITSLQAAGSVPRSCLAVLIMLIQGQLLTHIVRVPALSAGAGEGNPHAHLSFCHTGRYGKQNPTHDWNRYVKTQDGRLFWVPSMLISADYTEQAACGSLGEPRSEYSTWDYSIMPDLLHIGE